MLSFFPEICIRLRKSRRTNGAKPCRRDRWSREGQRGAWSFVQSRCGCIESSPCSCESWSRKTCWSRHCCLEPHTAHLTSKLNNETVPVWTSLQPSLIILLDLLLSPIHSVPDFPFISSQASLPFLSCCHVVLFPPCLLLFCHWTTTKPNWIIARI